MRAATPAAPSRVDPRQTVKAWATRSNGSGQRQGEAGERPEKGEERPERGRGEERPDAGPERERPDGRKSTAGTSGAKNRIRKPCTGAANPEKMKKLLAEILSAHRPGMR